MNKSKIKASLKWAIIGVLLNLVGALIAQAAGINDFKSAALLYAPGGFIAGLVIGWLKAANKIK